MLDILHIEIENLSFIFDELSVLVPLWLDWAFFSEVGNYTVHKFDRKNQ